MMIYDFNKMPEVRNQGVQIVYCIIYRVNQARLETFQIDKTFILVSEVIQSFSKTNAQETFTKLGFDFRFLNFPPRLG
jgi:hypothetical protein